MDELEQKLIAALRHNGRASYSDLAHIVGVSRATIKARMEKLEQRGDIVGYSVVTRADIAGAPVRALMMLAIEGAGTQRVLSQLAGIGEVAGVHTTNGKWDLVAEINTLTLDQLDAVLARIRRIHTVIRSETSILLKTRRSQKPQS